MEQSQSEPQAWLELKTGEKIPILHKMTLGRSKTCSHVLEDQQVSRQHVRIELEGGNVYHLIDLGSTHGTRVNRQRLDKNQTVVLHDGDQIGIGPYTLIFVRVSRDQATVVKGGAADLEATLPYNRPKTCWLLALDVVGFDDPKQAKPADSKTRLMGGWIFRSRQTIERHGGVISKFVGSSLLFAHWASQSSAQDEQFARCLREFQSLQALQSPPFRMVVHYGEASSDGGEGGKTVSLRGPDVDFIFEMARLASRLSLEGLFSKAAEQRLVRFYKLEYLGEHPFPDFDVPHPFFALTKK